MWSEHLLISEVGGPDPHPAIQRTSSSSSSPSSSELVEHHGPKQVHHHPPGSARRRRQEAPARPPAQQRQQPQAVRHAVRAGVQVSAGRPASGQAFVREPGEDALAVLHVDALRRGGGEGRVGASKVRDRWGPVLCAN